MAVAEQSISLKTRRKTEFKNNHLWLCNASKYVGENRIVKTAEKFNIAIENAPPKLYELYIRLYVNNGTMASVASELNYSIGYINKLNNSLVKYLYSYFNKNEEGE